jgi:hypothetical protein
MILSKRGRNTWKCVTDSEMKLRERFIHTEKKYRILFQINVYKYGYIENIIKVRLTEHRFGKT